MWKTQCLSHHGKNFPGFILESLSKIQGLIKDILQFSRAKKLGKILIQVLKFFFEIMEKLVLQK